MEANSTRVVLGNYKGIKVKRIDVVVTQEDIDAQLARACELAAKPAPKEGAAAEGDEALIDFIGYIDGNAFPGGSGEDYPLTLGSGTFIPGFEEQLVGAAAGDRVDVNVTFPENYGAAEFAGKDALFQVTVKEVRTTVIPEISDAVVAQVSQYKTVEDFVNYLRVALAEHKAEEAAIERENRILEAVVAASEITVEEAETERRVEILKNNLISQLRNSGNTFEQYLQYNGLTEEIFAQSAKNDAKTMLMGEAVLREIADAESMTCTPEELNTQVEQMAMTYQMPKEQFSEMIGEQGLAMITQDVLAQKALQFICAEAIDEE